MELKDDGIKDGHVSPVGFNRTFMELKEYSWVYRLRTRTFQSHLYGIERSLSLIIWHRMLVFQSHLYGIESEPVDGGIWIQYGFNRTFMELKATEEKRQRKVAKAGFNRTFMELKD